MSEETIVYGNGILAENGGYGVALSVDELFELILTERAGIPPKTGQPGFLGPPPSLDADALDQVRWGVIWPPQPLAPEEQAHRDALEPLLSRRRQQMDGQEPHQFHYQDGWTFDDFLWEEGREVEPGNMQPDIVPYYLCIVASPERIPWELQHRLNAEYAVGRVWFDDPADCVRYVDHLLAYEARTGSLPTAREALFVGPQNREDVPTRDSATQLVRPLHDRLAAEPRLHFATSLLLGEEAGREATKAHLVHRLKGRSLDGQAQDRPAFLFTACHGLEYAVHGEAQHTTQGALICQEWPGHPATPKPSHYLAASDVSAEMELFGTVAFCFACFGAGTPLTQDWVWPTLLRQPRHIAAAPFVARLPQKLLANGLLAFVGHVSRAWGTSFMGVRGPSDQSQIFGEVIGELLRGQRVGHATDYLDTRTDRLTALLDSQVAHSNRYTKTQVVETWKARNDCRGYAILGDPAARLRVDLLG